MKAKYSTGLAVLLGLSNTLMKPAYADETNILVSKEACASKTSCISDLTDYINYYDGLTVIEDLGGPMETAKHLVYGNVKDGKVTRAEAIYPIVRFVFPSSKPELEGKIEADPCTTIGSVPMRANSSITEEDVRNGRGMSVLGYCMYSTMYKGVYGGVEESFQLFDINNDGMISPTDDLNKDNMITLEDKQLYQKRETK